MTGKGKTGIICAAVVVLAAGIWVWLHRKSDDSAPAVAKEPEMVKLDGGTDLTTTEDPVVVFQKAFWRRPGQDDQILHAERREWSTSSDGVRKWQWFLVVKPGPQLKEWLGTNPFSLAKVEQPRAVKGFGRKPEWFPDAGPSFGIQQGVQTDFTLMFSPAGDTLYATDAGLGFAPADAGR